MSIYPYVYRLDHPKTKEFYIGYRSANKVNAANDIGTHYFTSSKYVVPRFHEFNVTIIAEFFTKEAAYDFEQECIRESIGTPGILNKHSRYNGAPRFMGKGWKWSAKSKQLQSIICKDPKRIEISKKNLPKDTAGENNGRYGKPKSEAERAKWDATFAARSKQQNMVYSRKKSPEEIAKLKETIKGRHVVYVSRLTDRKVMDLGNFTKYIKRFIP